MLGENTAVSPAAAAGEARRAASVLRDRYVLERRVAQGRFGAMYRALDRQGYAGRERVAILILPTEVSTRLDAFKAGFDVVRTLSHRNIVELYDLDRDGDTHFVVLEWVDGESLRSVMDTLAPETVCESDALGVVRAVGSALAYAHAKGIVHGDIRPENVIVTERGEVLLLFTPACLARSAPFVVTPRDDVRGLAALLYELMAGTPPPPGGLYGNAKDDEPLPIEALGRKRWKGLRSALSLRDNRIASAKQLLEALDLEPVDVSGRRPPKRERAFGRRPRGIGGRVVRLAALAAVAIAAVGVYRYVADRTPQLVDLGAWSAELSTRFDRAASWARESLVEVRSRVTRAGEVVVAYLERDEASSSNEATEENDAHDGMSTGAAGGDEIVDASADRGGEPHGSGRALPESRESAPAEGARRSGASDEQAPADAEHAIEHEDSRANGAVVRDEAPSAVSPETRATGAVAAASTDRAPAASMNRSSDRAEARSASDRGERRADARASEPIRETAVYFATPNISVSESGGVAAIRVLRTDLRGTLSFVWWTADGSAVAGEDYADLGRVVEQFSEGEAMRILYVPIVSDAVAEPREEYFEVLIGSLSPQGNQDGTIESARVTIVDDD